MFSSRHDVDSCRLCDRPPSQAHRRHWKHEPKEGYWHVIADGPDLMARLPRQAHFVTVLTYCLDDSGMPTRYRGPLYFELDSDDPARAFAEFRPCIELLATEYGCPLEAIHLWHSGSRGPHVTIPAVVIGSADGHPQLPRIYRAMVERLFPPSLAPSLDRGVYSAGMGRMWRLPNRRRSDNRRFKVPLAMREVLHRPYADLEALTHRPRKGLFWLPEGELSPCPALVELYRETTAATDRECPVRHRRDAEMVGCGEGILFYAFQARGWLGDEIDGGKWAVQCPWEASHTKGECFDTSTILFAPGDGDATGWFYCSHMHCQGRGLSDVLALFTPAELDRARAAAGIVTMTAHGLRLSHTRGSLRTVPAKEVLEWRR